MELESLNSVSRMSLADDRAVTPGVYYPANKYTYRKHRCINHETKKRAVSRSGQINLEKLKSNRKNGFFSNCFIKMVEARWRWTILNFVLGYILNWLFFGVVYWFSAFVHGDLNYDHLPQNQNMTNWTPCIKNIYGFASTLLFSVEVHTTVAYGKRAITLECPQTILVMSLQCILSSIFQAFMVGMLFAKLTSPKSRTKTILFSKHAVIGLKDKNLSLSFRVGDMRKSRILNIKAAIYLVRLEDELKSLSDLDQTELPTFIDGCESTFFLWPVAVTHVIDEKSPLYNLSAADLISGNIELIAVFEGTIESTGQPVQAITSYTESEIVWGHRFVPMISYHEKKRAFRVDYSKLSTTEQIITPLCSAYEYETFLYGQ